MTTIDANKLATVLADAALADALLTFVAASRSHGLPGALSRFAWLHSVENMKTRVQYLGDESSMTRVAELLRTFTEDEVSESVEADIAQRARELHDAWGAVSEELNASAFDDENV